MLKDKLLHESWNIAIRPGKTGNILEDVTSVFHVIPNEKDFWIADPFLFEYNDKLYIFAELMDYKLGRGVIACTIYNPKTRTIGKWKKVIVEDYHLSFPFIFEKDGEIYIMPESNRGNCLSIYRAVHFPDEWEKKDILHGYRLADTAIYDFGDVFQGYTLHHAGKTLEDGNVARLLKITFQNVEMSEEVYSKDYRINRLGGGFFLYKGKMIRVAQDCSESYGKKLIFLEFDAKKMWEKEWKTITTEDVVLDRKLRLNGIHTYNSSGGYEIIDLKTQRFSILENYWKAVRKIKRMLQKQ